MHQHSSSVQHSNNLLLIVDTPQIPLLSLPDPIHPHSSPPTTTTTTTTTTTYHHFSSSSHPHISRKTFPTSLSLSLSLPRVGTDHALVRGGGGERRRQRRRKCLARRGEGRGCPGREGIPVALPGGIPRGEGGGDTRRQRERERESGRSGGPYQSAYVYIDCARQLDGHVLARGQAGWSSGSVRLG